MIQNILNGPPPIDLVPIARGAGHRQRCERIRVDKVTCIYDVAAPLRSVGADARSRYGSHRNRTDIESPVSRIKQLHHEVACNVRRRRPACGGTGVAELKFNGGQRRQRGKNVGVVFSGLPRQQWLRRHVAITHEIPAETGIERIRQVADNPAAEHRRIIQIA